MFLEKNQIIISFERLDSKASRKIVVIWLEIHTLLQLNMEEEMWFLDELWKLDFVVAKVVIRNGHVK